MEGLSTNARWSSNPSGLFLDSVNRILYVADTGNNRVRTVDIKNYKNPAVSAMNLTNLEGDVVTLGGTVRSRGFRMYASLRDLDAIDTVSAEIEVKRITDPFDGSGTYIVPPINTVKGSDSTSYYVVSGNTLELGGSYHIRIRASDQ